MAAALEYGDIYFFQKTDPGQELFLILRSHDRRTYRVISLSHPKMPDPGIPGERHWLFVEQVTRKRTELDDALKDARPVANGLYALVLHGRHSHLAYLVENPQKLSNRQTTLNIRKQTSYVITVKNPRKPRLPGAPARLRQARFPERLVRKFKEHRFNVVSTPEYFDHEGAELVLTTATDRQVEGLEVDFHDIPVPPLVKEAA